MQQQQDDGNSESQRVSAEASTTRSDEVGPRDVDGRWSMVVAHKPGCGSLADPWRGSDCQRHQHVEEWGALIGQCRAHLRPCSRRCELNIACVGGGRGGRMRLILRAQRRGVDAMLWSRVLGCACLCWAPAWFLALCQRRGSRGNAVSGEGQGRWGPQRGRRRRAEQALEQRVQAAPSPGC
jgi:hypothetical protein